MSEVAQLLSGGLSSDTATRVAAEAHIKQLQNRPGWRTCLLLVGLANNQADALRTLALLLFKNQIDALFRRSFGPATVSTDGAEKQIIKRMLLDFHCVDPSAVAATVAAGGVAGGAESAATSERVAGLVSTCIGMCARHDWPRDWSAGNESLFPRLLAALSGSPSPLGRLRATYTLHQVLKSLQSGRLALSVAKFQAASEAIIPAVRSVWMDTQAGIAARIQAVVASGNAAAFTPELVANLADSCKLALLNLKCLRRLITYGIADISTSSEAQTLFPCMLEHMQKLVSMLPAIAPPPDSDREALGFLPPLFATFHLLMRLVNDTLDRHHVQFRVFFAPFVQFATSVLNHNATALATSKPLDGAAAAAAAKSPQAAGAAVDPMALFPSSSVLEPFCIECLLYLQKVLQHYSKPHPLAQLAAQGASSLFRAGAGGGAGAGASPSADQALLQIHERMAALFTPAYISQLLALLLSHYLVLKRSDLEQWAEDPEAFYNEERSGMEDGDDASGDDTTLVVMSSRNAESGSGSGGGANATSGGHEFKVRMVAGNLVQLLLEKMPETVAPALVQMLMAVLQVCPPGATTTTTASANNAAALAVLGGAAAQPNLILLKESVYTALGYGYLQIPAQLQTLHKISFDTLYAEILAKELAATSPPLKLIRRRVVWLLGEWVEHVTDDLRMRIYSSCVALLHENDLLVRMASIDTLFKLIDNVPYSYENGLGGEHGGAGDSEHDVLDLTAGDAGVAHSAGFEAMLSHFATHLSAILSLLFNILQAQLEELETKRHVLIVLSKILGVMKSRVMTAGCLPLLIQHLPAVWSECQAKQNLLRTTILDVITNLVNALGWQSEAIHAPIVLPMLAHVLDVRNAASSTNFVVEFALDLWQSTMRNAVRYTPELAALFGALMNYMRHNTSYLRRCMTIIESYVHLGRADFMKTYAASIADIFSGLLTQSQQIRLEQDAAKSNGGGGGGGGGGLSAFKAGSVTLSTALDGDGVVNEEAIVILMAVLEGVAQIYPQQVPQLFQQTFHFMLRGLLDEAHFYALSDEQQAASKLHIQCDQVLASYLIVLGRLFFQNVSGSVQLLATLSGPNAMTQLPLPTNALLSTLLSSMHRKLDCIAHVYKKKVCVLAMVQLMHSADPTVLGQTKIIMACVRRIEKELNQRGAQLEQPDWSGALNTPPEHRIEAHRIQLVRSTHTHTRAHTLALTQRLLSHVLLFRCSRPSSFVLCCCLLFRC